MKEKLSIVKVKTKEKLNIFKDLEPYLGGIETGSMYVQYVQGI